MAEIPDEDTDLRERVRIAIGEAVSNLGIRRQYASVTWGWVEGSFQVITDSPELRERREKLEVYLDFVRRNATHGMNTDFLDQEHGLGYYLMVSQATNVCFDDEGRLVLTFADSIPEDKHLVCV